MSKEVSEFHKLSHAHHEQRISAHKAAMDAEDKNSHRHAFHKASIAHHEPLRDFHKAAMEKAASGEMNKTDRSLTLESIDAHIRATLTKMLSDALAPTNISAVIPNRPGVTAVPRAGKQAIPEKIPVPAEFEKLADIEA